MQTELVTEQQPASYTCQRTYSGFSKHVILLPTVTGAFVELVQFHMVMVHNAIY